MENQTDNIILFIGISLILIGTIIIIKNIITINKNKIITGEIYDFRSSGQDHYLPVIKYEIDEITYHYFSTHHSILQKIGRKIRLAYNLDRKSIIGTIEELFFKPVILLLIGIFITIVMVMYLLE